MIVNNNALIGYSGFVGSNLLRQATFTKLYNSKNILEIKHLEFDTIVCTGTPGLKWKANKYPEEDWKSINHLIDNIKTIKATNFILISTVNVYPTPYNVNEDSVIDIKMLDYYGKHRRQLELFVESNFNSLILRLPTIFGEGMKKNIIFDLMNNQFIDSITKNSVFQYYFLDHLWADIEKALENNITLLNIATEPIPTEMLGSACFNIFNFKDGNRNSPNYKMLSKHASHWGGTTNYLYTKKCQLKEINAFIECNKG